MVSDKFNINNLFKQIIAFFIQHKWILITLFVLIFIHQITKIRIEIELNTDSNNSFSIYWAEKGSYFHESRRIKFPIYKDKFRYKVDFNLFFRNIYEFRIDPLITEGRITINKIVIKDKYFKPIIFDEKSDFEKFIPLHDIKSVAYDSNQMTIVSAGIDPYLALSIKRSFDLKSILAIFVFSALISTATIVFLVIVNSTLFSESYYRYTLSTMLISVLLLVIIMAFISSNYSHPDENVHFKAAEYYFKYWMPPTIGDKRVEGTYSPYGVSRLYSLTPLYLFAAKFSNMIHIFIENRLINIRLFNVVLLAIIVMLILCRSEMNWLAMFIFLCPQMWYIFSYINDDAFPLFISFMIFYQIAYSKSIFNNFRNSNASLKLMYGGVWLGLLLGMLFISKKNYYSMCAFIFAYLLLDVIFGVDKKRLFTKYCFVVFIAALIFGGRFYYHQMINDFNIKAKSEILEDYKEDQFKSNIPIEKTYYGLWLKEKGVEFSELFSRMGWHRSAFSSFVGMYGHVNISSDADLYKIYLLLYASFITVILFVIFRNCGIEERLLCLLVLCLSTTLILASLYRSWTVSFQAQGRYLFPIIIMFSFLFFRIKNKITQNTKNYYTILFFCLSTYSFIFTALSRIPKR